MKKFYFLPLCLLFLINSSFAQTPLTEAVDFEVTTVHGEAINLFELLDEGKHVLVDFFFTTCGPCIESVPTLNQSFEKYGCNKSDIFFVSIDAGDNDQQVLDYEESYGGLLPSASGTQGGGDAVVSSYGITAFPTVVLIAPDRSIIAQDIYPVTHANLDGQINGVAAIAENPTACSSVVSTNDLKLDEDMVISPNPVMDDFSISFALPEAKELQLEIFNYLGQNVYSNGFVNFNQGSHTIQVSAQQLSNGYHALRLTDRSGKTFTKKLVVQH